MKRALVTGGAGFIGSHLADELVARGYSVRVLDALIPQVHGVERARPSYLAHDVELVTADIRDREAVRTALMGVDVVFHFASRCGVGQSMYEIAEYTSVNSAGTAVLLEALIEQPVRRLVVASSMSIYGEGLYRGPGEQIQLYAHRTPEQLARNVWDPQDDEGRALTPVPTPESKPAALAYVYSLTKYDQERMCLLVGAAYKMPTVALRLFNVYGPRQHTGVLASFAARLLDGNRPLVFEDGRQRRDFVHVRDVATAACLALEVDEAAGQVFNIGNPEEITIGELAGLVKEMTESASPIRLIPYDEAYQPGFEDMQRRVPNIEKLHRLTGFSPKIKLAQIAHRVITGKLQEMETDVPVMPGPSMGVRFGVRQ